MKANNFKILVIGLFFSGISCIAQDFIRVGVAADFNKDEIVQTITLDLNRTEKIDEKVGKNLIVKDKYYILPSADINIGDKVTSSENNILTQIILGKFNYTKPEKSDTKVTQLYRALEFNPTFNADKDFIEKITYGQLKYTLSKICGISSGNNYVNNGFTVTGGLFSNIGLRNSKTYSESTFYFTGGALAECKWQWFKKNEGDKEPFTNWQIKLSGNYYYIISEQELIYDKNFAGFLKFSIDKHLFNKMIYIGINYKLSNDSPLYKDIHTLELALKLNILK